MSISEDAPEPFEWAHGEELKPDHGEGDVDGPDGEDDAPELWVFDGCEVSQAVAVEEGCAEDGVEEVVGECHASDGGEWFADDRGGFAFGECDDEGAVTEGEGDSYGLGE